MVRGSKHIGKVKSRKPGSMDSASARAPSEQSRVARDDGWHGTLLAASRTRFCSLLPILYSSFSTRHVAHRARILLPIQAAYCIYSLRVRRDSPIVIL